jgi:hypothetical protein
VNDEIEELPPGQTDEIGRRMADVIEEQDEVVSEHVDPHWEVFYDEGHDEAERIVHLHDDEKVPAKVIATPGGGSRAECTECDATLDIAAGSPKGSRAGMAGAFPPANAGGNE